MPQAHQRTVLAIPHKVWALSRILGFTHAVPWMDVLPLFPLLCTEMLLICQGLSECCLQSVAPLLIIPGRRKCSAFLSHSVTHFTPSFILH